MIFASIWSVGAQGFSSNSAALAMVFIAFYAIGATLLVWMTSLIGGKAKMAGYAIATLGGIASLVVFINEAVKLVNLIGKTLGI